MLADWAVMVPLYDINYCLRNQKHVLYRMILNKTKHTHSMLGVLEVKSLCIFTTRVTKINGTVPTFLTIREINKRSFKCFHNPNARAICANIWHYVQIWDKRCNFGTGARVCVCVGGWWVGGDVGGGWGGGGGEGQIWGGEYETPCIIVCKICPDLATKSIMLKHGTEDLVVMKN